MIEKRYYRYQWMSSEWRRPFLGLVFVIILMTTGVVVLYSATNTTDTAPGVAIDLLNGQDWSHTAGVDVQNDGLHITPLGRIIAHQDGSLGQPYPPVNLAGVHANVEGDFQITATVSGVNGHALLWLYGDPPIVYDEWRKEGHSMNLDIESDAITVRVWDGTAPNSLDMRQFTVSHHDPVVIMIEHKNHEMVISADKTLLGSIPDHDVFDTGTVWFGADAPVDSAGWVLGGLTIQALPGGHGEIASPIMLNIPHDDASTLRNIAAQTRKFRIGAAVSFETLFTDEQYRNTVAGQFNIVTPENSMKPQFIHPLPDAYVFAEADSIVDFALENDMLVHGHTLVYAKANPSWMYQTRNSERETIMIDHIQQVVTHFKGRVAEWDVVNEPLVEKEIEYTEKNNGLRESIWWKAMGEQYIEKAFRAAHKADPSAKLYLNDYGLENNGKRWDTMLSLVKRLKKQGVPIDGVGFESHVYYASDKIHHEDLRKHIKALAALGLGSRISEIDVYGDDPKVQADQYADVLKVCLSEPTCTSYTTWGISDRYGSTTRPDRYPLVTGNSLLWDKDMKPKPAYVELQNVLK